MSDDIGIDPYAAVLADLRAKRNKIDEAIALIESLRGDRGFIGTSDSNQPVPESLAADDGGQFLGMTVVDATKKLLAMRRKTIGTAEIAVAIQRGGLVMQSAEPANTVGSILTRRFYQIGDIVRVSRGTWGLREWYPHTNFKRKEEASPSTRDLANGESPIPPLVEVQQ
jgi:HB1, ASXL, restriction endonuclease HTH domain